MPPPEAFGLDPLRGFLAATDPPRRLPDAFAPWEALHDDLPALIMAGRVRAAIAALPLLDPLLLPEPERERALILLGIFAAAYAWGGEALAPIRFPPPLGRPLGRLAAAMGRVPILTHATTVLFNWRRLDPAGPLALDNLDLAARILGGVDERWFFLATIGVELAGAPAVPAIVAAVNASLCGSDAEIAAALEAIAAAMEAARAALARMDEWCDPYVFYHRVRRWLAGWPEPGAVLEGSGLPPQVLAGGSAAQSSLLQAVDAALGIAHPGAETGGFLRAMRRYMPPRHRAFVEAAEGASRVRARAAAGSAALRHAHAAAVAAMEAIRRDHLALVGRYIVQPSRLGAAERGTGGTDFLRFLRDARAETAAARLG
jgi:indoleamine 2,3-dioxygenase